MTQREIDEFTAPLILLWLAGKHEEVAQAVAQKTGESVEKVRQAMAQVVQMHRGIMATLEGHR